MLSFFFFNLLFCTSNAIHTSSNNDTCCCGNKGNPNPTPAQPDILDNDMSASFVQIIVYFYLVFLRLRLKRPRPRQPRRHDPTHSNATTASQCRQRVTVGAMPNPSSIKVNDTSFENKPLTSRDQEQLRVGDSSGYLRRRTGGGYEQRQDLGSTVLCAYPYPICILHSPNFHFNWPSILKLYTSLVTLTVLQIEGA
ncbi:hypothetical protein BDN67DRAFT_324444 [Paxillus ammoniavirescens]|nr:hypothetical protein BDN67DRAFT_324444 [Paxillus ammoniavirescens]